MPWPSSVHVNHEDREGHEGNEYRLVQNCSSCFVCPSWLHSIHESPLRPIAHRPPARRQRAHRALQLAARTRAGRHVHPPHRGHRRRALHARVGGRPSSTTCGGSASTGTRASRRAATTAPTARPSACRPYRSHATRLLDDGQGVLLLLFRRPARSRSARRNSPRRMPPKYPGTCRHIDPDDAARRAADGRARRGALPRARGPRGHLRRRRPRDPSRFTPTSSATRCWCAPTASRPTTSPW